MYAFLRFADQDKVSNLSEVLLRFSMVESEYECLLQAYPTNLRRYLDVIRPRARDIQSHTYVNACKTNCSSFLHIFAYDIVCNINLLMCSCCLASKNALRVYAYDTSTCVMTDLQEAFEFMTDTNTCVVAL
jgi:hypothetical protein